MISWQSVLREIIIIIIVDNQKIIGKTPKLVFHAILPSVLYISSADGQQVVGPLVVVGRHHHRRAGQSRCKSTVGLCGQFG